MRGRYPARARDGHSLAIGAMASAGVGTAIRHTNPTRGSRDRGGWDPHSNHTIEGHPRLCASDAAVYHGRRFGSAELASGVFMHAASYSRFSRLSGPDGFLLVSLVSLALVSSACVDIDGMDPKNPQRGPGELVGNGEPITD